MKIDPSGEDRAAKPEHAAPTTNLVKGDMMMILRVGGGGGEMDYLSPKLGFIVFTKIFFVLRVKVFVGISVKLSFICTFFAITLLHPIRTIY